MFRKKAIYVILTVILSLALLADVLVGFLLMNAVSAAMPDFAAQSEGVPSFPEGATDFPGRSGGESGGPAFPQDGGALPQQPAGGNPFARILRLRVPVLIVCVLGIAFCVFMQVRIGKKQKARRAEEAAAMSLEDRVRLAAQPKKKKKTGWLLLLPVALIAGAVLFLGRKAETAAQETSVEKTLRTAQVGEGVIRSDFIGGGYLEEQEAVTVSVPEGVEISGYLVHNGDAVSGGTAVAMAEKNSVMLTVAAVQKKLDALDAELEAVKKATTEVPVTAPAGGRVMKIYAAAEDAVTDVMYAHGSLALLSLDGLMAADVETDALAVGNSVSVRAAAGTFTGRVAAVADGIAQVTVSDEKTVFGETVTVLDRDGRELGSGELYIHSESAVLATGGSVKRVLVKEGRTVRAGEKLLQLTDATHDAEYRMMLTSRRKLEDQMAQLFLLYKDQRIYAETAGRIDGIPDDAKFLETAETEAGKSAGRMKLLSVSSGAPRTILFQYTTGSLLRVTHANGPLEVEDDTGFTNYYGVITAVNEEDNTFTVAMAAESVGISDYTVLSAPSAESLTGDERICGIGMSAYVFAGKWTKTSIGSPCAGDTLLFTYDTEGHGVWTIYAHTGQEEENPDDPGKDDPGKKIPGGGGRHGGFGGFSFSGLNAAGSDSKEEENPYAAKSTAVCTVTPLETVSVQISVDETDILEIAVGQEAVITMDAIGGTSFTGTVTELDLTGTNEGGNTKYVASIDIPRDGRMLAGMSVSARITVGETGRVLTLPVNALQEEGNRVFVYTGTDPETGEPSEPVDVKTGVSDGATVEIRSGLAAGQTVYYLLADEITYAFGD